jgi:flagellar secretion chaperone FliS
VNINARSVYLQGVGQDANPVHLIILLYEQLIADLRRALAAIEKADIEERTIQLSHAMQVLGELDAALNMQAGLEVAQNLNRFYGLLRSGLFQVQVHPDRRVLDKYIAQLLSLREAWIEVERKSAEESKVANQPVVKQGTANPRLQGDWRA